MPKCGQQTLVVNPRDTSENSIIPCSHKALVVLSIIIMSSRSDGYQNNGNVKLCSYDCLRAYASIRILFMPTFEPKHLNLEASCVWIKSNVEYQVSQDMHDKSNELLTYTLPIINHKIYSITTLLKSYFLLNGTTKT